MSVRARTSGKNMKEIKTFTYFIPAPPHRKNGYREKEFDKIMAGILQSGFELVDLKTEGTENGMFVLALLKAPNKKIAQLDKNLDLHEHFQLQASHSSPDIILEADDA
jgi:hypothetical protein